MLRRIQRRRFRLAKPFFILIVVLAAIARIGIAPAPAQASSVEPAIYFSEVLWAGSDRSTSDEWFELSSHATAPVELDGWSVVASIASCNDKVIASLDGLAIAPNGSLLVAHADQHHQFSAGESALATDPDLVLSSLTLSNTKLALGLCDHGQLVDVANDGGIPFKGTVFKNTADPLTTIPPSSMERIDAAVA